MKKKVVIVGGGITGLSLAFRLSQLSHEKKIPLELKLIEASDRFGGTIHTQHQDGFLVEAGPDAFITDKPWALELCERLGLENEIIPTNALSRRSFVFKKGKLHRIPEGLYLIIPRGLKTIADLSVLSFWGKLRMLMEVYVPRAPASAEEDESVAHFIRRRFGQEVFLWLGQPMIAGIYSADANQLSLKAAMPRFYELERRYGSLIRGLRRQSAIQETSTASGPRYSLFVSFKKGMKTMTDALRDYLPDESKRLSCPIRSIEYEGIWRVYGNHGEVFEADSVCLAIPSYQAASLLQRSAPRLSQRLSDIAYESVATVTLAYRRRALDTPLQGFGFVVPQAEKKNILGCTFCHEKFEGRVPSKDYLLLRAFMGGAGNRNWVSIDDETLKQRVHADLEECLRLKERPVMSWVYRAQKAMPQYQVGHLKLMADIDTEVQQFPGLHLLGNAFDGIGIPDLIHSSELAAEKMMTELSQPQSFLDSVSLESHR